MASMQFNSDSDKQDICSYTDDLVNTNSTKYSLQAKARAANKWNRIVWGWIFDSYGGIQYDDTNQGNLPRGVMDLSSGTQIYPWPSGALTIREVQMLLPNGTTWQELSPMTYEQIQDILATKEYGRVSGIPTYYAALEGTIELFPLPNYSMAGGLRVNFDRGSVNFASTDTTKQPGFASEFHDVLPVGMAYEFGRRKGLPQTEDFIIELNGGNRPHTSMGCSCFMHRIKRFYNERYHNMFPGRITVRDGMREFS